MSLWISSNRQATAVDRGSCSSVADVLRTCCAGPWPASGLAEADPCTVQTWIELQHRFYERIGRAAYCYSERTNVGLFAAAVWRCDQIAIEEFEHGRATVGEVLGELIFLYKSDDVRSVLKRRPFMSERRGTKKSGKYSGASFEPE